jgi:pilus assembly protein TadC
MLFRYGCKDRLGDIQRSVRRFLDVITALNIKINVLWNVLVRIADD